MLLKGGREKEQRKERRTEGRKEEEKGDWAEMLDHCKAFWK